MGNSTVPQKHCVILEAPHTSIWDFAIGYFYYRALGGHLKVMIKKEAFFFPFGLLLKALGGIPIDRKNPTKAIMDIIRNMDSSETFHLVICPEGTRKAVKNWKTGYHTIASAAKLPVYLSAVDWGHKRAGIFAEFEISSDARSDTRRIQEIYGKQGFVGKHPEGYITE